MATFNSAARAIEAKFKTWWDTNHSGKPVEYMNTKIDPPDDIWARIFVNQGEKTLIGLGANRLWRGVGLITIQVFDREATGTKIGEELAKAIETEFQGVTFSGVMCKGASTVPVGTDGRWFQWNVQIPFLYNELDSE